MKGPKSADEQWVVEDGNIVHEKGLAHPPDRRDAHKDRSSAGRRQGCPCHRCVDRQSQPRKGEGPQGRREAQRPHVERERHVRDQREAEVALANEALHGGRSRHGNEQGKQPGHRQSSHRQPQPANDERAFNGCIVAGRRGDQPVYPMIVPGVGMGAHGSNKGAHINAPCTARRAPLRSRSTAP